MKCSLGDIKQKGKEIYLNLIKTKNSVLMSKTEFTIEKKKMDCKLENGKEKLIFSKIILNLNGLMFHFIKWPSFDPVIRC